MKNDKSFSKRYSPIIAIAVSPYHSAVWVLFVILAILAVSYKKVPNMNFKHM